MLYFSSPSPWSGVPVASLFVIGAAIVGSWIFATFWDPSERGEATAGDPELAVTLGEAVILAGVVVIADEFAAVPLDGLK